MLSCISSVVTFGGMKECKKVTDPEDFSFMDDCRSDVDINFTLFLNSRF